MRLDVFGVKCVVLWWNFNTIAMRRRCAKAGLKIRFTQVSVGSSPTFGTQVQQGLMAKRAGEYNACPFRFSPLSPHFLKRFFRLLPTNRLNDGRPNRR